MASSSGNVLLQSTFERQQRGGESLAERVFSLSNDPMYCEAVLIAQDGRICAPVLLLAASSPLLAKILQHQVCCNCSVISVLIPGVAKSSLELLMSLLRTGQVTASHAELAEMVEVGSVLGVRLAHPNQVSEEFALLQTFCWEQPAKMTASTSIEIARKNDTDSPWQYCRTSLNDTSLNASGDSYKCSECDRKFPERDSLAKHSRQHQQRYQCQVCSKFLSRPDVLAKHMKIHSRVQVVRCHVCSREFARESHLAAHMKKHENERSFQCVVCTKAFTQSTHYRNHIRSHTGEKPYPCTYCDKAFANKDKLLIHVRTHTGEKPFVCTTCHKAFSRKDKLSIHMRVHSGEKPFLCPLCHKRFSQRGHLVTHWRTHTGEKPFKCNICGKNFAQLSHMKTHARVHTTNDNQFLQ